LILRLGQWTLYCLHIISYLKNIMLVLIVLLIAGSFFVYISKFNFMPVSVNLGLYVFSDIPLFYVMIGSLVTGLVLSYVVYMVHSVSTSLKLRGKDHQIKKNQAEVLESTKRVHQLELENEKLKQRSNAKPKDPRAL